MSIYLPIFQALNEAKAHYVVVGGLATVLHGYARLTADIDLIIDLDKEEATKIIDVLIKLGLVPRVPVDAHDFIDIELRNRWFEEKNMRVFSLWNPKDAFISVDLFVENPIEFNELWLRANEVDIGGQTVRIAAIPDLITLKKLANRPQDLEDIRQLEEILKIRDE